MWRPASDSDFSNIVEMCRNLYSEDPGLKPVPDTHMETTLRVLASTPVRGKAVVLEINGQIVGYALLISSWSNELGGEICNIDELYLRPHIRGCGHGTALITSLKTENSIWSNKPVAIALEVTPHNSNARAFYEKLGFIPLRNTVMRLEN